MIAYPTPTRRYPYCRVSTDKQEQDGESLDYPGGEMPPVC